MGKSNSPNSRRQRRLLLLDGHSMAYRAFFALPTDMATAVLGEHGAPDELLDLHPIRRIATLEEVSETVCFIAGPHAAYITGQTINVAGGLGI